MMTDGTRSVGTHRDTQHRWSFSRRHCISRMSGNARQSPCSPDTLGRSCKRTSICFDQSFLINLRVGKTLRATFGSSPSGRFDGPISRDIRRYGGSEMAQCRKHRCSLAPTVQFRDHFVVILHTCQKLSRPQRPAGWALGSAMRSYADFPRLFMEGVTRH